MASSKNPFKVLGLDPSILRELSDEQISGIVRSQYRTLQKIYHPDGSSGDDKKSRELQEAYSLIGPDSDSIVYEDFKKKFLKVVGQKKKISELEEEVESYRRDVFQISSALQDYVLASSEEGFLPLVENLQLGMHDTALSFMTYKLPSVKSDEEQFYTLKVDDGVLSREQRGVSTSYPGRKLFGVVSDDMSHKLGGMKNLLRDIGVIIEDDSERDNRMRIAAMKPFGTNKPARVEVFEPRISPAQFESIMPHLSPFASKYSHLFSIDGVGEGEPYFTLEGKIVDLDGSSKK